MSDFLVFMALTSVMGLSIFLSLPIVYSKRAQGRWATGLNAGAIGILIFLSLTSSPTFRPSCTRMDTSPTSVTRWRSGYPLWERS